MVSDILVCMVSGVRFREADTCIYIYIYVIVTDVQL